MYGYLLIFYITRNYKVMKNTLLSFFLLLSAFSLTGQSTGIPVSVAYFGQFGFQPGVKIATEFPLNAKTPKANNFFISPQIGFFVRSGNNANLLLNADVGMKRQKEGKSGFSAFSFGLGYLHQFQISGVAIQLGDGGQTNNRSSIAYFLPSFNYTFGNKLGTNLDWYSKIGYGQRLGGGISSSTIVLLEVGVQFYLK